MGNGVKIGNACVNPGVCQANEQVHAVINEYEGRRVISIHSLRNECIGHINKSKVDAFLQLFDSGNI